MGRTVWKLSAILLTAAAWASAAAAPSPAQIAFVPCQEGNNFACAHLAVPLDPGGSAPGTLALAIRRHRAPIEGPSSAVIPLAGGPGQAAIPLTEAFVELLGPIVATRDLIVFDQRGTGLSHPLTCRPAKATSRRLPTLGQSVKSCALGLGASRSFYTTPDSVADIEAIRQAGGYEKLVLYGTSYGTKVAEQYAQRHPGHVEALVLDSVVPPDGPDPLNRATFAAVPRILRQLCRYRECAQITSDPVADLRRVVARTHHGGIHGRVLDRRGRPHRTSIGSDALVRLLLDGDFNPLLRAEFVPAVRAAANGDSAALARLLGSDEHVSEEGGAGIDAPLYLATTCEEEAFPWSRAAAPGARVSQASAQVDALPARTFTPFTAANAIDLSGIEACAFWPFATAAPAVDEAGLPNVPALILSGESDLRTPTANALQVAGQIPDSHLLVVPYAGHSVLTNEPTSCASDALQALFAGRPIKPCKATPPPPLLKLPGLPPPRMAAVRPARAYHGLPGRTLHAAGLTFEDLARQLTLGLLEALTSGSIFKNPSLSAGGLRAGWYELKERTIVLHGYSYVPGMNVSGRISGGRIAVGIGGPAAAHGYLRTTGHGATLAGVLGGVRVRLSSGAASAPAGQASAQEPLLPGAEPSSVAGPIADALRQLPGGSSYLAELPRLLSARRLDGRSSAR